MKGNTIGHTSAPWYREWNRTWGECVRGGVGYNIGTGKEEPGFIAYRLKSSADAHLISAAPELLEACQLFSKACDEGRMLRDFDGYSGAELDAPSHAAVEEAIEAAIKKATGAAR